jgi:DNA-binding LytR/AlgR family response regulator
MEKARVLIVEDQLITARSIEAILVGHGMEVLGICKSGEETLEMADRNHPDLVLMDIKLQGKLNGIQTATALQDIQPIPVIYLSDYTDKATVRKATETHPANYLAKPFTESDLLRAIDIAISNFNASKATAGNDEDFVFLKTRQQTYSKLRYNDIIYVEADRAYSRIQAVDNLYTLPISMAAVASQLSNDRFVKIHRSYIVNIRKVSEFTSTEVTAAGYKLPVSDQHRAGLMTRLKILH